MRISGSVALVTGSNRGTGRHFAEQLLERGAKVYATARDPESIDVSGVERLRLDNAGISTATNLVTGDLDKITAEIDTNFYGTLHTVRAFAPILAANGGGAILNVLSALSWVAFDGANAYSVAKAAEWSLTNGIRLELAGQGTVVTGIHLGPADTDMMAGWDIDKVDPADVVRAALDAIERGQLEVLVDEHATSAKARIGLDPRLAYPELAA